MDTNSVLFAVCPRPWTVPTHTQAGLPLTHSPDVLWKHPTDTHQRMLFLSFIAATLTLTPKINHPAWKRSFFLSHLCLFQSYLLNVELGTCPIWVFYFCLLPTHFRWLGCSWSCYLPEHPVNKSFEKPPVAPQGAHLGPPLSLEVEG